MNELTDVFNDSLLEYRAQLDTLDAQLISVLAARFAVTEKVGQLKARHRAPAADSQREATQLERLLVCSRECGLAGEVTRAVYETLFGLVRDSHRAIAAQGE